MLNYLIANNPTECMIKDYVIANGNDLLFDKIKASNKNIADCITFVSGEVKKIAGSCKAFMLSDDEVYSMCIHYFEEDSISKCTSFNKIAKVGTTKKKEVVKESKKEQEKNTAFKQVSLFDM